MGLRSLYEDLKHLRLLMATRDRLKEAAKMGHLKAVGFALAGAILTGVLGAWTGACPGLVASLPAIGVALIGSFVTIYMRKPLTAAAGKAAGTGVVAFGIATAAEQLKLACGADFVAQFWTLALAGAWVGLGLWLKAPHESPGPVYVTPPGMPKV